MITRPVQASPAPTFLDIRDVARWLEGRDMPPAFHDAEHDYRDALAESLRLSRRAAEIDRRLDDIARELLTAPDGDAATLVIEQARLHAEHAHLPRLREEAARALATATNRVARMIEAEATREQNELQDRIDDAKRAMRPHQAVVNTLPRPDGYDHARATISRLNDSGVAPNVGARDRARMVVQLAQSAQRDETAIRAFVRAAREGRR